MRGVCHQPGRFARRLLDKRRGCFLATVTRHQEISEAFLEHAEDELENGELLQASEKAWGAVAHYVKSIARELRWPNRSHQDIRDNTQVMVRYTDDPAQSSRLFAVVENLHTNFYEDRLTEETVRRGIEDAGALIYALRSAESQFPRRRPRVTRFSDRVSEIRSRRRK